MTRTKPLLSVPSRLGQCHTFLPRHFSTSKAAFKIGPESPRFIEVPQPIQPQAPGVPVVKGVLPVPRQIFSKRGPVKTSKAYYDKTVPKPNKHHRHVGAKNSEESHYLIWKKQSAELRRRNLREGLLELSHRKINTDNIVAARSAAKQADHQRLINEPEREDERLTNPSILVSMKQQKIGMLPDPNRESRIVDKTLKLQERQAAKEQERKDRLHTLYTQAREFITTEAQLNEAIDRTFVEYPEEFTSDGGLGENIWNRGSPETVQQMLNEINRTGSNAIKHYTGVGDITQKRVRRIAEELTGGRL
ncbi:hypothetical protein L228DRAFT_264688 [Xylona heveae TC161]|uniref:Uncharacterized protein n=1 Tax=Xylona heveae (strain CBS 132557 / TC161) TaxID=1328760 RepID=A0A165JI44_XYLHT|nr:hypothetical protein L228DRAFT_264688 [Xylona heveae TC161]KZF26269.1 hypothetical protein L228DRAFT_264688 [Xylona heveae TC161]